MALIRLFSHGVTPAKARRYLSRKDDFFFLPVSLVSSYLSSYDAYTAECGSLCRFGCLSDRQSETGGDGDDERYYAYKYVSAF